MKLQYLLIVVLLTFSSCTQNSFEDLPCDPLAVSQNRNLKRIFKPCRQYVFSAKYYDREFNLISDEKIWLMATGMDWQPQERYQSEIVIQYDFDESKITQIDKFNLNPERTTDWVRKEATGIIENEAELWMHPFRANQYAFTEMAAFPNAKYPLEPGLGWTSNLDVQEGWGRWSNSTVRNVYNVAEREQVSTGIGDLNAILIKSRTMTDFGNSIASYWFNEEYGFIKMAIRNYEGQLLAIELVSVTE